MKFKRHPKIILTLCAWCRGTGSYVAGKVQRTCTQCNGRGCIVRDDA